MKAQIANAILGVFLLAAPGALGIGNPAAAVFCIVGPVVATFAVVACWEVTRGVRWANVPLGIGLAGAPFIMGFQSGPTLWISLAVGLSVAALACIEGTTTKRYGGGWPAALR